MSPAGLQGALPGLAAAVAMPGSSQDRQPEEPQRPHSLYLGCRESACSFLCLCHLKTRGNWCKQTNFPGLITPPASLLSPGCPMGLSPNSPALPPPHRDPLLLPGAAPRARGSFTASETPELHLQLLKVTKKTSENCPGNCPGLTEASSPTF